MAKISALPRLANPIGTELVPAVDANGVSVGVPVGPLVEAAGASLLARAEGAATQAGRALASVTAGAGGMVDLQYLAPNAWPDPDNTGRAAWSVNGTAPQLPTTGLINDRPTIIAAGKHVHFRVNLDDAGCPVGQDMVFAFTPLSMSIAASSAGATLLAQMLDANGQVISGSAYTFFSGKVPPAVLDRYQRVWRRTEAMKYLEGYLFFGDNAANRGEFTDFLIAPGTNGSFRPALLGRELSLPDYMATQDAIAERWTNPNAVPDQSYTGLTSAGWNADVPVLRKAGRRSYQVSNALRRLRGSIAGVGAAGASFSASAVLRLVGGTQAASVTFVQVRSNGTSIAETARSFALTSETWSRDRYRPLTGMIVHQEATGFEIVIDAQGGGLVEASLLSVHGGDNPAWRPALPSADKLRQYIGLVSSAPAGSTPHYYVDARPAPNASSDADDGTSEDTPFRTMAAALTAVGSSAEKIIAIRRGSVFRGETIESPAPGLTIQAYGEGADPLFLGSLGYHSSFLTAVGDGTFTLSLDYKPSTLALVEIATGEVVKLYNQDANPAVPAAGDWSWANDLLRFHPKGLDLTKYRLEVPLRYGPGYGFNAGAARQTIRGISFEHWRDHGASTSKADTRWIGVWCNWSGFDGFDQDGGADRFLIRGGGAIGNGRRFGSDLGPGDGSSAHLKANGVIEGATFKWNTQTGVGDLYDTMVEVRYCYFEDNQVDLQVYVQNGGTLASPVVPGHWWHHNLHVHKVRGSVFAVNSKQPDLVTRIHHLTAYSTISGFCLGTVSGTQVDLANSIFHAPNVAYAWACYVAADGSQGKVTSRNNIASVLQAPWQEDNENDFSATRGGGSEVGLLTSDPLFLDPANGDFSLRPLSPAIGSAIPLGYARDYSGKPVSAQPSRGAIE